MIGLNRAPGWQREFAAESWPSIDASVWKEARQEVEDRFDRTTKLRISGSDGDDQAIRHANQNLERSGLDGRGITFRTRALSGLATNTEYGVLVTNPPYGERLSDPREAERLYAEFGRIVVPWLQTWSAYIITNHPGFSNSFGRNPDKRRKLYNGMIECTLHQYLGPRPPKVG
jgi:putative N6-adenine-specific DNA methylase